MAADLSIHVLDGVTEEDLEIFFNNTLGSKHFSWTEKYPWGHIRREKAWNNVANSPQIWIGAVSWLKAGLFESDEYIPNRVAEIYDLIGEHLPVINDELISTIREIFERYTEVYMRGRETEQEIDEVFEFLNAHKGKKIFTVSW